MTFPKHVFGIVILVLVFPINSCASEYCTFSSFYKESSSIAWVLAGVVAVITVAIVIYTGGSASPMVASVGTWIGNMMGYSGIVATNSGLALLGGGSVVSGGWGIAGGVAILTLALTFGEEIVIGYTLDTIIAEYNYSEFSEDSKSMTTLPIPQNTDGTESYSDTVVFLKDKINSEETIFSNYNQEMIGIAGKTLDVVGDFDFIFADTEEQGLKSKEESLYALLCFISNDYKIAKIHAKRAIGYARYIDRKRTLPAFIYATSSLYDKRFNFEKVTRDYFRYSVLAEPDNPLIPLLFSIYLDRVLYRFNDGYLTASSLKSIAEIACEEPIRNSFSMNVPIVVARYLMLLKTKQQKISALASAENNTVKNSKKTLEVVRNELAEYEVLLLDSRELLDIFLNGEFGLDEESYEKGDEFLSLLTMYNNDRNRLNRLVNKLARYQWIRPYDVTDEYYDTNSERVWFAFLVFVLSLLIFLCRRKRAQKKVALVSSSDE